MLRTYGGQHNCNDIYVKGALSLLSQKNCRIFLNAKISLKMYERMWKVSIFYSALTCKSRHMGGARHSKNQCNDKILSVHVFYGFYGILLTSQISLYAILVLLSAMCSVSLSS